MEVVMATMQHSLALHQIKQNSFLKELMIVLGASLIICLSGPIAIHLPFTPVPITLQCHVILLLAALLGSKRGTLAVIAYLAEGAMGLPVFAGGNGGIVHLLGPTGGYLVGYAASAFATGFLMEKVFKRTPMHSLYAMGIGNVLLYAFGLPWLSLYCGWQLAFKFGMFPFLIGDFLKLIVAGKLLQKLRCFRDCN
jgi:biotin transport system substrate-specific component